MFIVHALIPSVCFDERLSSSLTRVECQQSDMSDSSPSEMHGQTFLIEALAFRNFKTLTWRSLATQFVVASFIFPKPMVSFLTEKLNISTDS